MPRRALQPKSPWPEDTALLKSTRSAAPGAETEERAAAARRPARASSALRDRRPCAKLSRQDAATCSAGCDPQFANAQHSKFHFTLNQYSSTA